MGDGPVGSVRPEQPKKPASGSVAGLTYGPRELMDRLNVSENTIYRELQYGFLKDIAFRVGRQWRVSVGALERLMEGGQQ